MRCPRTVLVALLVLLNGALKAQADGEPRLAAHVAAYQAASTDSARLVAAEGVVLDLRALDMPLELVHWPDTLLRLARARHDTLRMLTALKGRGEYLSRAGEFVKLEGLTKEMLPLVDPGRDPRGFITLMMSASYSAAQMGDPDLALERLLKAVPYADRDSVKPGTRAQLKYSLGRSYLEHDEPARAIPLFRESIVWSRERGHRPSIAQNLHYLGKAHRALGLLDSALVEQEEAVAIVREDQDRPELVSQLVELGDLLVQRHEGRRARPIYLEAMRVADSAAYNDDAVRARLGLARLTLQEGGNPLALLVEAEGIADRIHLYPELRGIELLLTQVYAQRGQMDKALAASQRVVALGDTLFDIGKRKALLALSMRYESERKDREIAGLQQEKELQAAHEAGQQVRIERQRQLIIGTALIGALLLLAALLAVRGLRIKRRAAAQLEMKNAEVLRQKERAEASEKAKDRFLANVSHEVRTPLNAMMGFTGLLMHEVKDERAARFLGNIRDAGDNLLVVINDVLDLSRIEAGRLQLVQEPFDLHRCIRLCAEILQHRAAEQRDTLAVDVAGAPQWVLGDSARLTQVVLNLVGNALKFTTNGSVGITARAEGGKLVLRVSDTGIGIPPEKLDSIFERFTQVHEDDRRIHGGTGLGLSIVKELVQLHNGTIAVESRVGAGTDFTVRLPLREVQPPDGAVALRTAPPASLEGRTVLVAEDNDMNALVTEETLARAFPQARIERVKDGEEAVRRMEHGADVALVLMDVQMPRLDGISAARAIRRMGSVAKDVPIIALTASVLPNDLSRCIDAGMDACVPKPFKADELLAAIARLTGDRPRAVPDPPDREGDPLTALFRRMVPERLKALKEARARGDREKMQRVVHSLRPQLVHHDAPRFEALCGRILAFDAAHPPAEWDAAFDAFILALEQALAQVR